MRLNDFSKISFFMLSVRMSIIGMRKGRRDKKRGETRGRKGREERGREGKQGKGGKKGEGRKDRGREGREGRQGKGRGCNGDEVLIRSACN